MNSMQIIRAIIWSLRPKQVVKNGFLFVGLIFSQHLFIVSDVLKVIGGACLFTLLTWSVYLINDLMDRERDRIHPVKKNRPIASGELPVSLAILVAVVFGVLALVGAFFLQLAFGLICSIYGGINLLYSRFLKQIVILDIMSLAAGFFLRVIAGTQIIEVEVTHWLAICSIFLSLFLGFCKRRAELSQDGFSARPVLKQYTIGFLDQLIAIVTGGALISYLLYSVSPETVARFHTDQLIVTSPFVMFGMFRYLYLLHTRNKGQDTANDILFDRSLLIAILGWISVTALIIYG